MAKLTPKQARFVDEYLIDLNATQAVIRAGYSAKRASEISYQLLQKTTVQLAIQSAMRERSARTGITQDRVIQEIAIIGFADLSEFVDWGSEGVSLKDSTTIDKDRRRAIVEVKQTQHGISIKLADKNSALEKLARHTGIYDEPTDPDAAPSVVVYLPDNGR